MQSSLLQFLFSVKREGSSEKGVGQSGGEEEEEEEQEEEDRVKESKKLLPLFLSTKS